MPGPARVLAAERARRLLPGVWLGWMLCVALLATPSAFALLARADAGRVVARLLAGEAYIAVALGVLLLTLERFNARRQAEAVDRPGSQFSLGMVLSLATVFCTVAGYFALQPLMEQARAGQGGGASGLSFGSLHAISAGFFLVKVGCVAALAWRAVRTGPTTLGPSF